MATGELVSVAVPDIGDFADVPVIEILVAPGDQVAVEDPLVTLESDKATMDVPSPTAGVVRALHVSVGDHVSEGSALVDVEPAGEHAAEPVAPRPTSALADAVRSATDTGTQAEERMQPAVEQPARATEERTQPATVETVRAAEQPSRAVEQPVSATSDGAGAVYASPSVRHLARELGVDLRRVAGSGRKGRITGGDVRAASASGGAGVGGSAGVGGAVAGGGPSGPASSGHAGALSSELGLAPWPRVDFEQFGPVERVARSRIQRLSAPNLARNWVMIPHVTQNDEADITELEAWRKQLNQEQGPDGVKVTMVSFLVAASVATLKAFPTFNASLDGEELVLRRYYNIGFAADTPDGLVVPVIKHADAIGLLEIAQELSELSGRARQGRLSPADISGGTFTISSLGGIGGTSFTPIINAPEVAILGVTRAVMRPVWDGSAFVPRLMLPLSLSYDHRVIDGAAAARFVVHLVRVLSDLRRILL